MNSPWRDVLASALVVIAVLAYAAWLLGGIAILGRASVVALVVLALGAAASMSAVVPGFAELLRGSRPYLGVASVLGLVALGAGLWAMATEDGTALALLVLATIALWGMSTMSHLGVHAGTGPASS